MAKTWTEQHPVKLTEAELIERGESLALQEKRWRDVDAERKNAADEFKSQLAEIEAEQYRLAEIVREREEPRPVVVTEVRDFTACRVDVVRKDTGEVVRTRVMTESERQLALMPDPEAASLEEPEDDERAASEASA